MNLLSNPPVMSELEHKRLQQFSSRLRASSFLNNCPISAFIVSSAVVLPKKRDAFGLRKDDVFMSVLQACWLLRTVAVSESVFTGHRGLFHLWLPFPFPVLREFPPHQSQSLTKCYCRIFFFFFFWSFRK